MATRKNTWLHFFFRSSPEDIQGRRTNRSVSFTFRSSLRICLLILEGEGGSGEITMKEKHISVAFRRRLNQGSNPQPSYGTFWCMGRAPNMGATQPGTSSSFLKILFIFREKGREGERERETAMCGCLSCVPYWGPGLQPSHVS